MDDPLSIKNFKDFFKIDILLCELQLSLLNWHFSCLGWGVSAPHGHEAKIANESPTKRGSRIKKIVGCNRFDCSKGKNLRIFFLETHTFLLWEIAQDATEAQECNVQWQWRNPFSGKWRLIVIPWIPISIVLMNLDAQHTLVSRLSIFRMNAIIHQSVPYSQIALKHS